MSTLARNRINRPLSRRRCVNCSLLLLPKRRRAIEELDQQMLNLLMSWITPTSVSSEDILCLECFALLQERTVSNMSPSKVELSPAVGHLCICYGCGVSILRCRTNRVSQDCPQRDFILRSESIFM